MVRKGCKRCEVIPTVHEVAGKVYVFAPLDVLIARFEEAMRRAGYFPRHRGGVLLCQVDNFKGFLRRLIASNQFAGPEREDIQILFVPQGERLRLFHLQNLQPLGLYLDLVQGEAYLEIFQNGRLTIYFHPIFDVRTFDIVGYECLARGLREDGTLIPPRELFRFAERTDTLFFFDRVCREMAIKAAASKIPESKAIFINFVPGAIYDPRVCLRTTVEWIQQLSLAPSRIVFEVVETYRIEDLTHLKRILESYREMGFRVALDDFGTGYANLETLVHLAPDIIKIDQTLTRGVAKNPLKPESTALP
ncbi:MAG: EAL domain-containing protein [Candidatus Caldatribacterium sp.]|nr:EAL domain-containing protein [Candidatus Caldatribacterium sp.]